MKIDCAKHGEQTAAHLGNQDVMCQVCYEQAVATAMQSPEAQRAAWKAMGESSKAARSYSISTATRGPEPS